MQIASESEITALLERFGRGELDASDRLIALLYSELHQMAVRFMKGYADGEELQAATLVSEAFLRLNRGSGAYCADRGQFLAQASRAMRCVLIEHARARRTRREVSEEPDFDYGTLPEPTSDFVALDVALEKLKRIDPGMARAVELRFFAGLTVREVARVLDTPRRTLERKWTATRAWLLNELS